MTSQAMVNLILFGNIGLWLVAALIGWKGAQASYLASEASFRPFSNGFAFRKPWEGCACLNLVGFLSLLMPLVVATNDLSLYGNVLPSDWPYLWVFIGIGMAGAAFFCWMGRPMELAVDEDWHTYRWSEGWPFFCRVRTGALSNLSGVGAIIGSGSAYFAYVGGPGGAGKMIVERFSSAEGAEYYADELAAVLDVPRLAPGSCRWPQLSSRKQRAYAEAANLRPTYRRCRRYLLQHFEPCPCPNDSPGRMETRLNTELIDACFS